MLLDLADVAARLSLLLLLEDHLRDDVRQGGIAAGRLNTEKPLHLIYGATPSLFKTSATDDESGPATSPVGEVEHLLADRIASAAWRLRRLIRTEVELFKSEGKTSSASLSPGLAFLREANKGDSFSKLSKYEGGIERGMYRALAQFQRLQAARSGQPIPPPAVLDLSIDLSS